MLGIKLNHVTKKAPGGRSTHHGLLHKKCMADKFCILLVEENLRRKYVPVTGACQLPEEIIYMIYIYIYTICDLFGFTIWDVVRSHVFDIS